MSKELRFDIACAMAIWVVPIGICVIIQLIVELLK